MQLGIRRATMLLLLGLAACGGETPEDAASGQIREACLGLGSTAEACDCFVDGVREALGEDDIQVFLQSFASGEDRDITVLGDQQTETMLALMRVMTAIVPVAAGCEVDVGFSLP